MEFHWDRLKELGKKGSIGGWILWLLAASWKRLGDWQNVEWLRDHLLPKVWSKAMPHPNYITVGFVIAGFIWLTVIVIWPRGRGTSRATLGITHGPVMGSSSYKLDVLKQREQQIEEKLTKLRESPDNSQFYLQEIKRANWQLTSTKNEIREEESKLRSQAAGS